MDDKPRPTVPQLTRMLKRVESATTDVEGASYSLLVARRVFDCEKVPATCDPGMADHYIELAERIVDAAKALLANASGYLSDAIKKEREGESCVVVKLAAPAPDAQAK